MKRSISLLLCLIMLVSLFTACAKEPAPETTEPAATNEPAATTEPAEEADAPASDEEYVFMMCQANIEYWNQHKNAMYDVTKELGVNYSIVGVESADATDICTALETVVAQKPAGIVIAGWFPDAFVPIFEKAWELGVPIATTTIDVPDSKRICFFGTDYYNYGKVMADAAAEAVGEAGKVIIVGNLNSGSPSQLDMYNGINAQIKEKYPGMEVVSTLEDEADADVAVQVVSSAITANPDAAVIIGMDALSGVGSVTALREVGMEGKVKIVCIDRDAPTLEAIKEGSIYATVAGKQYSEVYYAVKMLYDYNHNRVPLVADNKATGIIAQPTICDPGAVVITAENVDDFIAYDINAIKDPNYK